MKRAINFWREAERRPEAGEGLGLQLLSLVFLITLIGPFHGLSQEPAVIISSRPGFPGQVTDLSVTTLNTTNVVAAQFDFTYEPSHVSLNALQPSASLSNHIFRSHALSPGVRRVLIYSIANTLIKSNATLGTLSLAVPPGERVGSGPIVPSNIFFARSDASALEPVEAQAGAVFVSQVYRNPANGEVRVYFPSQPSRRYLLQATIDFATWVNLSTNLANAEFIDLVDADSPNYPYRFYRLADFDSLLGGVLGNFSYSPSGQASFKLTAWEGRTYAIQASTNLQNWATIGTRVVTNGQLLFQDPDVASFPRRFYRLASPE